MKQLTGITSESYQSFELPLEGLGSNVTFVLRFFPTIQAWCFNASYGSKNVYGVKLSVGVLHIQSKNMPFDFSVVDNSGNGLDPFKVDDFSTGRCTILALEPADIEGIRGIKIEQQ